MIGEKDCVNLCGVLWNNVFDVRCANCCDKLCCVCGKSTDLIFCMYCDREFFEIPKIRFGAEGRSKFGAGGI